MSHEPTKVYLEIMEEELKSFRPVMLNSSAYKLKDKDEEPDIVALEDMAQQAIDLGCKYVANIQTAGLFGRFAQGMLLFGTGLIPKE